VRNVACRLQVQSRGKDPAGKVERKQGNQWARGFTRDSAPFYCSSICGMLIRRSASSVALDVTSRGCNLRTYQG
jgi:hypothetical protein